MIIYCCQIQSTVEKERKYILYRVIKKELYIFKNLFYKYYWTYGDVLYIDWRENSQNYFHTLQALDVSLMCDAVDIKSIIQLFPHSSQHVTGNSSHSLSYAPSQIIDIRILRDFLSIRTQDMDSVSVDFVKSIFESVHCGSDIWYEHRWPSTYPFKLFISCRQRNKSACLFRFVYLTTYSQLHRLYCGWYYTVDGDCEWLYKRSLRKQ
jgi:hypothetical protein